MPCVTGFSINNKGDIYGLTNDGQNFRFVGQCSTKQPTHFNFLRTYMKTFLSPKAKMKIYRPDQTLNSDPDNYW